MAWYDTNKDWALEAVNSALRQTEDANNDSIDILKSAAGPEITINPLSLLGGIAGSAVIGNTLANKKEQEYKQLYGNAVARLVNEANKKMTDMGEDHYSTIANVDRDLRVMFTPFSVVYLLRSTVVDTIAVDTMTSAMKNAWRSKDTNYFKALMLNKVYLEAQNTEQMFIRRLIEHDKGLKTKITKSASSSASTEPISVYELFDKYAMFGQLMVASAKSPALDKYAAELFSVLEELEPEAIPVELGALRMAQEDDLDLGLVKLAFLRFTKDNTITVGDLRGNTDVSYLPDRVLFINDGIVISQLNTFEMNEDGYAHFKKKDSPYFKKLFIRMAKTAGHDVTTEPDEPEELTKEAAYDDVFVADDVHPKVYYLIMMKEFGERWLEWDMDTLTSMLSDNLGVTPGDVAANKLMCISLLFNGNAAYTGYHTFEKVIRSFNNKDIDFEARESNLSLGEFVNGIEIMGDLISDVDDNIYDNFSDHVFSYLVEVLAAQDYRVCVHKTNSDNEAAFWKLVNFELKDWWNKQLPNGLFSNTSGVAENTAINNVITNVANQLRGQSLDKIHEAAIKACVGADLKNDAYYEIVTSNVQNALAVDKFMPYTITVRDEQIRKYTV